MQAFEEGKDVSNFVDSGLLPRLDSHLGSLLMDIRHLEGELGKRFQTYEESCQMTRRGPRGRAFLFLLSQHFRLDLNRGSNSLNKPCLICSWMVLPQKILRNLLNALNMCSTQFRSHISQQRHLVLLGCTQGLRGANCCSATLIA